MQKRENRKEFLVGCGALAGILVFVFGLIGSFTFFSAGTFSSTYSRNPNTGEIGSVGAGALLPLGVGFMGFGILLFLGSAGYGWYQHLQRNKGPVCEYPSALVLAKFAFNKNHTLLTQSYEFDYDDARFYVRMQLDAVNVLELETSRPVFDACGEGMRGGASVQGKWLGMFQPYTGHGVYLTDDRMAQHYDGTYDQ